MLFQVQPSCLPSQWGKIDLKLPPIFGAGGRDRFLKQSFAPGMYDKLPRLAGLARDTQPQLCQGFGRQL